MIISVKYCPCIFDESTWISFESHNQTVYSVIHSLFQKYPEVRDDSPNITIRVNGKIIHPLLWKNKLNDGDEVLIIQEIGWESLLIVISSLGISGTGVSGAALTLGAVVSAWATVILTIASIAYTIYSYATAPSAPKTGGGLNSSPTYGWDGLQMQVRQGVPVPIVYGEHLFGGNLIEAYISSDDDKNYLNLLIGLGEGPIEGIMKEDLSGVCTSIYTEVATVTRARASGGAHLQTATAHGFTVGDSITISGLGGTGYNGIAEVAFIDDSTNFDYVNAGADEGVTGDTGGKIVKSIPDQSSAPYVLINDNLLSNFKEVTWDYRLGTHDQTQIDGFGDICQTYSTTGAKITTTPYTYTTVDSDVEGFELRFRIPAIYGNHENYYYAISRSAHVQYKLHSAGSWTDAGDFSVTATSQTPVRRFFRVDDLAPGQYDIKVTGHGPYEGTDAWWTATEQESPGNMAGAIYLDNIIEIKYDTLTYPFTALLAIKVLATEQLSGQLPNVLTRIRGRKVLNLNTEAIEWTNNPIYCVNDLMVNSRYGTGDYVSSSNINHDQLILMATHCDGIVGSGGIGCSSCDGVFDSCTSTSLTDNDHIFVTADIGKTICVESPTDTTIHTKLVITSVSSNIAYGTGGWSAGTPTDKNWEWGEKRYELDLVIDSQNPAFDAINQICGSFRALPIWNKDAIQLLIEKKESPSYIFNMGNIIEKSFKHTFQSEKSKPSSIQVDYADKVNRFQKNTVDVVDYAAITGGVPMRTRRMSLLGASRRSQIYREGRFHLYAPKYQDEQISFKGSIDAIHMLPGDVGKFQHDVFAWGSGGRVISATTTAVTLDQPVTIGAGTHVITCKLADDTLETRTISDGAGTYTVKTVTIHNGGINYSINDVLTIIQGGANTAKVRVTSVDGGVVDGVELTIVGSGYTLANELTTTVLPNVGSGCELNITEMATSVVTATVAFTTAPPVYGLYAFGLTGVEAKPFRIMSVLKTPENEVEVSATEYSDSVYSDTNIVLVEPVYSNLPPDSAWPSEPDVPDALAVPPDVTGFDVTETTDKTGVSITFVRPATTTNWYKAKIYISRDGGTNYEYINTMYDVGPLIYRDVVAGTLYWFKAVSASPNDINGTTPPTDSITIVGVAAVGITSLTTSVSFKSIFLNWVTVADTSVNKTEVWRANTNDRDGASLITSIFGTSYTDIITSYSTTRYYWVRNKNPNGVYSAWYPVSSTGGVSGTTEAEPGGYTPDTTPPGTPTGLSLSTGVTQAADGTEFSWIRATWTANSEGDISHYEYRIKETGGNYIYGYVTANEVLFQPVRGNILHYVGIKAIDKSGNKSAFCTDSSTTSAKDTTAPSAPTAFTATGGFQLIWLSWTNPSDTDLALIEVYRNTTDSSGTSVKIAEVGSNQYVDTGLPDGALRYYWLKAKDLSANTSGFSSVASATTAYLQGGDFNTTAPGTPTGLGLTTGTAQSADGTEFSWIRATWTANTEDDLSHYEYRIKETGGNYLYGFVTSNDRLFSPVRGNILHYVGIRAIDVLGNKSAFCTDSSTTSAKDTGLPAVPTSFVATSSFKTIFLTWVNSTDKDLSHVNIYRGATSTRGSATLIAKAKGTFYADDIGTYPTQKYYWIASEDWSGNVSATEAGPVNATTAQIASADIGAFAIAASQIFTNIPIITGDTWTNNSPSSLYVAWNAHKLYYNGVEYSISASNTNLKYIYWLNHVTHKYPPPPRNDGTSSYLWSPWGAAVQKNTQPSKRKRRSEAAAKEKVLEYRPSARPSPLSLRLILSASGKNRRCAPVR